MQIAVAKSRGRSLNGEGGWSGGRVVFQSEPAPRGVQGILHSNAEINFRKQRLPRFREGQYSSIFLPPVWLLDQCSVA
jgi:hypothetical protein